ncbi:Protein of unknown function DUF227,CHK kinase-like,Protein kinase-like domain [Cinara cedri]|uniref:CHK kinase-like domain-containing protein n=1 Tax=Cinara cedri TaxID=506608 RepID=A0A5E4NH72_9HEMI|nr:Protein of unknown function DUF227,CHK kinase-like,Protein kinase-like domain [Cinara cedri]
MTTVPEAVWSMDVAVADMIDAGAFGPGSEIMSIEPDSRYTGQDQYATTVYFSTVTIRDRGGNHHSHHVVFKIKKRSPGIENLIRAYSQFHNEILFYERIMPFFRTCALTHHVPTLSRYIYGRNNYDTNFAFKDMVVLENACLRGYVLSEQRLHLNLEHTIVALKTLAKFHSLSYRAKHKDPERFAKIIADVQETHLRNDGDWFMCGGGHSVSKLLSAALNRLAQRRGVDDDDSRTCHFREKFMNDMNGTLNRVMKPHEPLAILCHGDFNRNNLLFRYDDDGRPVDALPFDLATVRYGSPALDLSFFLYMNTDRRIRDERWDELLDTYCASLAAAVSDVADVVRVPDRSQLDAEMREYGVYGLVHVSFFVRVMMEEHADISEFSEADKDKTVQTFLSYGGDKATDVIADALQHFLDTFCNRVE